MQDRCSLHSPRQMPGGTGKRAYVDLAPHPSRRNQVLAALSQADHERLLPDLEPVSLPQGRIIHAAYDREPYLYFLTSGIVARIHEMENGDTAEFAVTGREGVIGVATFLGGGGTPSRAMALTAVDAWRLRTDLLRLDVDRGSALLFPLLRYTQALIEQIGIVSACTRHHSLDQRLCRWLLSCLDRLQSDALTLTQESIAHMLGVRRESVTASVGALHEAGVLRRSRGRIVVLDRNRVAAQACECYSVVKRVHDDSPGGPRTAAKCSLPHGAGRPSAPYSPCTRQRRWIALQRG